MEAPEFIKKIDWSELRNQKATLLELIREYREDYPEEAKVVKEKMEHLEGILALIDAVQDYAVDTAQIVNAVDVYDFELEDGERSDMLDGETDEEYFARVNAKTIFEMHIEGTFLYENELMSKEFIESIVDNEEHATAIKEKMRLAILDEVTKHPENFKKDEHGHFTYDYTMYDYGYKIEDYCVNIFNAGRTKTVYVCPNCGSENVEYKTWTNPNTMKTTHDHPMEVDDCYCNDCDTHDKLIQKQIPLS